MRQSSRINQWFGWVGRGWNLAYTLKTRMYMEVWVCLVATVIGAHPSNLTFLDISSFLNSFICTGLVSKFRKLGFPTSKVRFKRRKIFSPQTFTFLCSSNLLGQLFYPVSEHTSWKLNFMIYNLLSRFGTVRGFCLRFLRVRPTEV